MSKEIEISYNNIDVDELHKTFSKLNLICRKQKTLMKRKTYGFKNDGRGRWARVRDEGNKITMTIKEVLKEDEKNIHDILEYELTVNDFETACSFLEECGMSERNYMENYREEWVDKGNEIYIAIDYFPFLNPYMKLRAKARKSSKDIANYWDLTFLNIMAVAIWVTFIKCNTIYLIILIFQMI